MGVLQIGTRAISHRELGQLFKNLNYDYFWVTHAKTPRGIHPVIPKTREEDPGDDRQEDRKKTEEDRRDPIVTVRKDECPNLSGVKKLVKDLSDRFDEYERSRVFKDKKILEEELILLLLAVTTSDSDDDDDTAFMDSQPYEPRGSPRDSQKVLKRSRLPGERRKSSNEAIVLEDLNVASVARDCTFAAFWNVSAISPFVETKSIGLIRWIERRRWFSLWSKVKMKVMMTEEFCPPEEIQRMEYELWNLKVKDMDISSYTTRFNELALLCPGMVAHEQKKVEAYIRGLSKNIKGEVTSSEPTI
ncbi:reverse transcriptase domain-containing protein [Tanacetum coccineum]